MQPERGKWTKEETQSLGPFQLSIYLSEAMYSWLLKNLGLEAHSWKSVSNSTVSLLYLLFCVHRFNLQRTVWHCSMRLLKKPEYKIIHIVHSCVVPGSKYIVMFHFYEMIMSAFKTLLYSHQPEWKQLFTNKKICLCWIAFK